MINKKTTTGLLRKVLGIIAHSKDSTVTEIYKRTDITYSHIFNTTMKLKAEGFITINKVGRTNLINITDNGKALLKCLDQLNKIYKEIL